MFKPASTPSISVSSSKNTGFDLVTVLHATVTSIARNGPPLDLTTQLCSVIAHLDLDVAGHVARENLRAIFRTGGTTANVQQLAA